MNEDTKDIAIVYLVGGISSRFGGKIKQFSKVGPEGETLIEYSLKQALSAGFSKIIFIVGNKTEKPFKEMFGNNYQGIPVYYALQKYDEEIRDKPWGTVEAVVAAKDFLDCSFVGCNGDDLYGEKAFKVLAEHLNNSKDEATVGYKLKEVLPQEGKTNRGIFNIDENNYIRYLKEVFDIEKSKLEEQGLKEDDLCSMNIFALHLKTIEMLKQILARFKQEHEGDRRAECLLPKEISRLIEGNKIKMKVYPVTERWFGITNPGDEEIVRKMLQKTYK